MGKIKLHGRFDDLYGIPFYGRPLPSDAPEVGFVGPAVLAHYKHIECETEAALSVSRSYGVCGAYDWACDF